MGIFELAGICKLVTDLLYILRILRAEYSGDYFYYCSLHLSRSIALTIIQGFDCVPAWSAVKCAICHGTWKHEWRATSTAGLTCRGSFVLLDTLSGAGIVFVVYAFEKG